MRYALLLLILFTSSACGYFVGGTWEDDPENWDRAFRSSKPVGVQIVRSHYWRGQHWSYEVAYQFHFRANVALEKQLLAENRLRPLAREELRHARECGFGCKPWFAPEPLHSYRIYTFANQPQQNFRVFIHRRTGDLYISDFVI
jgi:hypothetical protein